MKRLVSVLIIGFFSFLVFSPLAAAQATHQVKLTVPDKVDLEDEILVTIEVQDADGSPLGGKVPTISFDQASSVEDPLLTDCSDSTEYDACDLNNRNVAGLYEYGFFLVASPVTMTVVVDGVSKQVQLSSGSSAPVAEEPPAVEAPTTLTPTEPVTTATTVSPLDVKVGPSPSVWLILIPLALMGLVVTFFVLKTTK
ncbi:MAG: hypothetical protein U1C97_02385 [Candidatus Gracilibacteria bacterium]|nr:hypothetical protein [bacterium]MDZ4217144.1 hypothetical protein [Candidatus Gracilibacteria bacterium]